MSKTIVKRLLPGRPYPSILRTRNDEEVIKVPGAFFHTAAGSADYDWSLIEWLAFPGLSPEQKERIFEPFFATKAKGTGLGMAIARRIVQSHGGFIQIGSGNRTAAESLFCCPWIENESIANDFCR